MTRASLFVSLCVLALLCHSITAERRVFVNRIEPASQSAVEFDGHLSTSHTRAGDTTSLFFDGDFDPNAQEAGVDVDTPGKTTFIGTNVGLSGRTVAVNSDGVIASATHRAEFSGGELQFSVEESISITASVNRVDFEADSALNINTDAVRFQGGSGASVRSSSGKIGFTAADRFQLSGTSIDIEADNGFELISSHTLVFNVTQSIQALGNVIDFDSAGDFSLQSTGGNVNFDAGGRLTMEGNFIDVNGVEGVQINSEESSLLLSALGNVNTNARTGTININAEDDVLFTSGANHDVTIVGRTIAFKGSEGVNIDGDQVLVSSRDVGSAKTQINAVDFIIDSDSKVVVTSGGNIDLEATTLFTYAARGMSVTSKSTVDVDADVLVAYNALGNIELNTDQTNQPITLTAARQMQIQGGVITLKQTNAANADMKFTAGRDIHIKAPLTQDDAITFSSTGSATISATGSTGQQILFIGGPITFSADTQTIPATKTLSSTASESVNVAGATLTAATTGATGVLTIASTAENSVTRIVGGETSFAINAKTHVNLQSTLFDVTLTSPQHVTINAAGASRIDYSSGQFEADVFSATKLTAAAGGVLTSTIGDIHYQTDIGTFQLESLLNQILYNSTADFDVSAGVDATISAPAGNFTATVTNLLTQEHKQIAGNGQRVEVHATNTITAHAGFGGDYTLKAGQHMFINSGPLATTARRIQHQAGGAMSVTARGVGVTSDEERPITLTAKGISYTPGPMHDFTAGSSQSMWISAQDKDVTVVAQRAHYDADHVTHGTAQKVTFAPATDMLAQSDADIHIRSATTTTSLDTKDATFLATREFSINAKSRNDFTSQTHIRMNTDTLRIDAVTQDSKIIRGANDAKAAENVTLRTGFLSQSGGPISMWASSGAQLLAHERMHLSSLENTLLSSKSNITFQVFAKPNETASDVIFTAKTLVADGTEGFFIDGGDILVETTNGDDIHINAAHDLRFASFNNSDILVHGRGARVMTAKQIDILANGHFDDGRAISFESTHTDADIVLFARNSQMKVAATDYVEFKSHEVDGDTKIYAANDVIARTRAVGQAGGIYVLSRGDTHEPFVGTDAGIVAHADTHKALIRSDLGRVWIDTQETMDTVADAGAVQFEAGQDIAFNTNGPFTSNAPDSRVQFTAETGDISFRAGKDLDMQASRVADIRASRVLRFETLENITDPDQLAFEFSSDNGHIFMHAENTVSDIRWISAKDTVIEAGLGVAITSNRDITATSVHDDMMFLAETGITSNITDGDMSLTAGRDLLMQAAKNNKLTHQSGDRLLWTAGEMINLSAEELLDVRANTGDITVQAKAADGNIRVNSEGLIRFQADGVDNQFNGNANVHGIIMTSQHLDFSAHTSTLWEIENKLIVGFKSRSLVSMDTGGDSIDPGYVVDSKGSIVYHTKRSFDVDASGLFGINMEAGGVTMDTDGAFDIETAGTSPEGKDLTFAARFGVIDIDSDQAIVTGTKGINFTSDGVLRLETVGRDTIQNLVQFTAANDYEFDIARTFDVDSGTWNFVVSDRFQFTAAHNGNGDIDIRTRVPGTGDITVRADANLRWEADVDLDVSALGTGATLQMITTNSNSPIDIVAEHETSNVRVKAEGTFTAESDTTMLITAKHGVSITASDNQVLPGQQRTQKGTVTATLAGQFGIDAQGSAVFEGDKGIVFSTTGQKDVELTSFGDFKMTSRQDVLLQAAGDSADVIILASDSLLLDTEDNEGGSITLKSAAEMTVSSGRNAVFRAHDDTSFQGGHTVQITAGGKDADNGFGARFATRDHNAVLSLHSANGEILVDSKSGTSISGQFFNALSGGSTSLVAEAGDVSIATTKLHGEVTVGAKRDMLVKSPTLIDVAAAGDEPGQGYVDWKSGDLLHFLGTLESVQVRAQDGAVRSLVGDDVHFNALDVATGKGNIQITSSLQNADGAAIHFKSVGTGSPFVTTKTTQDTIINAGAIQLSSGSAEHPNGVVRLEALSDFKAIMLGAHRGNADGNAIHIESLAPEGDIVVFAKDFINGDILFDASFGVVLDGLEGVIVQNEDDDDAQTEATYIVQAKEYISLSSDGAQHNPETNRMEGTVFEAAGEANVRAKSDIVAVQSADDIIVDTNDNIEIQTPDSGQITISAVNGVNMLASSKWQFDTLSDFSVVTGGGLYAEAGNLKVTSKTTMEISAGIAPARANNDILLQSRGKTVFEASLIHLNVDEDQVIDVTSESNLLIPFIFKTDGSTDPSATGNSCAQATTTLGGPRSLFYNPPTKRLCYCRDNDTLQCYNMNFNIN